MSTGVRLHSFKFPYSWTDSALSHSVRTYLTQPWKIFTSPNYSQKTICKSISIGCLSYIMWSVTTQIRGFLATAPNAEYIKHPPRRVTDRVMRMMRRTVPLAAEQVDIATKANGVW
jgi:hypothetical protein